MSAGRQGPYWFPAKRYGWGWGLPVVWQGWVVLAVFFASVLVAARVYLPAGRIAAFLVCTVVLTFAMSLICWWKGEPPSWRWGDDE